MNATAPIVIAPYVAILGFLGVALTINVIVKRVRGGVDSGDGGIAKLACARIACASFAEHVPLALIVIAFAEALGTRPLVVHVLGMILVAARLGSAYALNGSLAQSPLRQFGGGATVIVIAAASVAILFAIGGVH